MNRRSLLRGLLTLPLVPVLAPLAAKIVERGAPLRPEWMPWVQGGSWKISRSSHIGTGTIPKYAPSSSTYTEIGGINVRQGVYLKWIRTGANWE